MSFKANFFALLSGNLPIPAPCNRNWFPQAAGPWWEPLGFNWPGKGLAQPCHQMVVSTLMVHQSPNIHHAAAFYLAYIPTLKFCLGIK